MNGEVVAEVGGGKQIIRFTGKADDRTELGKQPHGLYNTLSFYRKQ